MTYEIIGYVPAVPGWYVLDNDEELTVFKTPIVGWFLTMEQLALPVSPLHKLDTMPDGVPMLAPDGTVANRLGDVWPSMAEYQSFIYE